MVQSDRLRSDPFGSLNQNSTMDPPDPDTSMEEWEARVKDKLLSYKQSGILSDTPDGKKMRMYAKDSSQQKKIVQFARNLSLRVAVRSSTGGGHCEVFRRRQTDIVAMCSADKLAPVQVNQKMSDAIKQFILAHPIQKIDITRHLSSRTTDQVSNRKQPSFNYFAKRLIPSAGNDPKMRQFRQQLPAYQHRAEILGTIKESQVTLLTGGTGCGKTTQVPQFILEDAFQEQREIRVICTQPRRLPAVTIAERVAKERGENIGDTVGYHIRLEQRTSSRTILTYCTSGVLLRILSHEDAAKEVSHIILDEIHEREQNTDYLLIALKQAVRKRPNLKIILMSATMEGNLKMFMEYFGDIPVKHIDIPSRLFHVEKFFLGDLLALIGYYPSVHVFGGFFPSTTEFPKVTSWSKADLVGFPPIVPRSETKAKAATTVTAAPSSEERAPPGLPDHMIRNFVNQLTSRKSDQSLSTTNSQMVPDERVKCNYSTPSFHQQQTSQNGVHYDQRAGEQQWHSSLQSATSNSDVCDVQCAPVDSESLKQFQQMGMNSYTDCYGVGSLRLTDVNPNPGGPPGPPLVSRPIFQLYQEDYCNGVAPMRYFTQPMDGTVCGDQGVPASSLNRNHSTGQVPNNTENVDPVTATLNREEQIREAMQMRISSAIPLRPASFSSQSRQLLDKNEVNANEMVEIYRKLGGPPFLDSIDMDLVLSVIKFCMDSSEQGSILVFLPGYDDITQVKEKIVSEQWPQTQPDVFTLHSQMNHDDQLRVFEQCRWGYRKVILSTNIAEASLTIDDVVFVIDTGKVKEKSFDCSSRISQLKVASIAKSNAEQRSGRAGRCRKGYCFRLYSQDDYNSMPIAQTAEMQRSAIHEVCLHAKMFAPDGMSVHDFLALAPEPPLPETINTSMKFLEQLGAVYSEASTSEDNLLTSRNVRPEHVLTGLGKWIAQLPLDPQLARLLLFGVALKCLAPIVSLVASIAHKDPFILPNREDRQKANVAKEQFGLQDLSDHLALIRALYSVSGRGNRDAATFCRQHYLSANAMRMIAGIRRQLLTELSRAGIVAVSGDPNKLLQDEAYNRYSNCWPVVQAAIVAGCHPGIGYIGNAKNFRKIRTDARETANLHPSSFIKRQVGSKRGQDAPSDEISIEYLAFQELMQIESGLTVRNATVVPAMAVLLCAGQIRLKEGVLNDFQIDDAFTNSVLETINQESGSQDPEIAYLELDSTMALRGRYEDLQRLLQLRFKFMSYFLDVMNDPALLRDPPAQHEYLLEVVAMVLSENHKLSGFKPVQRIAPGCPLYSSRLTMFETNSAPKQREEKAFRALGIVKTQQPSTGESSTPSTSISSAVASKFNNTPEGSTREVSDSFATRKSTPAKRDEVKTTGVGFGNMSVTDSSKGFSGSSKFPDKNQRSFSKHRDGRVGRYQAKDEKFDNTSASKDFPSASSKAEPSRKAQNGSPNDRFKNSPSNWLKKNGNGNVRSSKSYKDRSKRGQRDGRYQDRNGVNDSSWQSNNYGGGLVFYGANYRRNDGYSKERRNEPLRSSQHSFDDLKATRGNYGGRNHSTRSSHRTCDDALPNRDDEYYEDRNESVRSSQQTFDNSTATHGNYGGRNHSNRSSHRTFDNALSNRDDEYYEDRNRWDESSWAAIDDSQPCHESDYHGGRNEWAGPSQDDSQPYYDNDNCRGSNKWVGPSQDDSQPYHDNEYYRGRNESTGTSQRTFEHARRNGGRGPRRSQANQRQYRDERGASWNHDRDKEGKFHNDVRFEQYSRR